MLRRFVVAPILAGVIMAAAATYFTYARDLRTTRAGLSAGSQRAQTRHGPIEYATWGTGPAVLAIHGAGGGYDQGSLMVRAFGTDGFRWVVPSRFGYLRTPMPADGSTAAQADALADLLDALGLTRVAILAMSGGVPPALQFAERHPERTTALVLLSTAPYTPLTAAEQKLPVPIWLYQALFGSDFPLWLLQKLAPRSLEPIFDVTPALRDSAPADEQAFVDDLVKAFQPVTGRAAGLRNEGAAIDPAVRYTLSEISTPTLVVHARDDQINPFTFGEYTAQRIRGAQFMPLMTGGHLLLGHHTAVRARVAAFLRQHAPR